MNEPSPARPSAVRAVIRYYQRQDHRWAWCYEEADRDLELHSNDDYATREEAMAAAQQAYPDVT
jgi:hypothetical protein